MACLDKRLRQYSEVLLRTHQALSGQLPAKTIGTVLGRTLIIAQDDSPLRMPSMADIVDAWDKRTKAHGKLTELRAEHGRHTMHRR